MRMLSLWALTGLLACTLGAQVPDVETDPKARFAALDKAYRAWVTTERQNQRKAIEKALAEAKESGGRTMIPAMRMHFAPPPDHLFAFQAAARDYARTEDAIPFLMWIVKHAETDKAASGLALGTLMSVHVESAGLRELPGLLKRYQRALGKAAVEAMLRRIEDQSSSADVSALAVLARVEDVAKKAPVDSKEYQAARADLELAASSVNDAELKARLEGTIAAREALSAGAVAQDIEGVDLDGVPFKLSDYKGKIIMLDFWGDW